MLSTVLIIVFMIATFEISLNGVYASNVSTTSEKQTITVAAGGGNATAPWTVFVPQEITMKSGDTVV
jgi:hypothetical protein